MFSFVWQDQNENEAILKIKESMQEEAKRFEKDTPNDHPDYFMPWHRVNQQFEMIQQTKKFKKIQKKISKKKTKKL